MKTYDIQEHRSAQLQHQARRAAMDLTLAHLRHDDDLGLKLGRLGLDGIIGVATHLIEAMANTLEKECGSKGAAATSLTRQLAESSAGAFGDAVLVDIRTYELTLNSESVVRATATLLDTANRHQPLVTHMPVRAALVAALACARDSVEQNGELFIAGPQEAIGGREVWAQLDPDGYVLMLPEDR
ncbi:hypothetical protein [Streptomyces sp. NPDC005281]|uniref:hypothetical protein n=1 Tax=Streptomyces sp. NPDC005281 TaxID=3155712 RepID=UPI0033A00A2F